MNVTLSDAEADERDSRQHTAFHVALEYGHLPILRYFLDNYPPRDRDSEPVLRLLDGDASANPLLWLALKSGEPEVVWLVLESGLADNRAARNTWTWICENEGQAKKDFGSVGKQGKGFNEEKFEETKELLASRGRFTPPPTPSVQRTEVPPAGSRRETKINTSTLMLNQMPTPPESPPISQPMPATHASRQPFTSRYTQISHDKGCTPAERGEQGKGRGRGRGRGRARADVHTRA